MKFKDKTKILREIVDEYNIFYSIAKDNAVEDSYIRWVLFTMPEKFSGIFNITKMATRWNN